jgi:hypothetical protein
MAKKRRPCPRKLYDGCPIPRELCTEDFEKTGSWHCLEFLHEFETMVFGIKESGSATGLEEAGAEGEIVTLEELLQALEGMDGLD